MLPNIYFATELSLKEISQAVYVRALMTRKSCAVGLRMWVIDHECWILAKFFFSCLCTGTESGSINKHKRTRPVPSYLDGTSLVNKRFIIWQKNTIIEQPTRTFIIFFLAVAYIVIVLDIDCRIKMVSMEFLD